MSCFTCSCSRVVWLTTCSFSRWSCRSHGGLSCRSLLLRGMIKLKYQPILFGGLGSADEGFPLRTLWPARVLQNSACVSCGRSLAYLPDRTVMGAARAAHGESMACALGG